MALNWQKPTVLPLKRSSGHLLPCISKLKENRVWGFRGEFLAHRRGRLTLAKFLPLQPTLQILKTRKKLRQCAMTRTCPDLSVAYVYSVLFRRMHKGHRTPRLVGHWYDKWEGRRRWTTKLKSPCEVLGATHLALSSTVNHSDT